QLAAITEHTLPAMRLAGEMQSHLAHFRLAEAMTLIALDQETKVTAAGTSTVAGNIEDVTRQANDVGRSAHELLQLSIKLESKSAVLADHVDAFVARLAG
ncbi:MAG: hypothetical protein P4L82_21310, partial [Ancalomicrobiaceae bacterium]|nr:hypothetical protein [Ancalomicrobiaceae bacterium]